MKGLLFLSYVLKGIDDFALFNAKSNSYKSSKGFPDDLL